MKGFSLKTTDPDQPCDPAMFPVKRVCRLVNPASQGDPLWANLNVGNQDNQCTGTVKSICSELH